MRVKAASVAKARLCAPTLRSICAWPSFRKIWTTSHHAGESIGCCGQYLEESSFHALKLQCIVTAMAFLRRQYQAYWQLSRMGPPFSHYRIFWAGMCKRIRDPPQSVSFTLEVLGAIPWDIHTNTRRDSDNKKGLLVIRRRDNGLDMAIRCYAGTWGWNKLDTPWLSAFGQAFFWNRKVKQPCVMQW